MEEDQTKYVLIKRWHIVGFSGLVGLAVAAAIVVSVGALRSAQREGASRRAELRAEVTRRTMREIRDAKLELGRRVLTRRQLESLARRVARQENPSPPEFRRTQLRTLRLIQRDPVIVSELVKVLRPQLERQLSLGQSVPGPRGPKGFRGLKGSKGSKGDTGRTGKTGAKGDKGDTGARGEKGEKGDPGLELLPGGKICTNLIKVGNCP